jgi:hypothetical protein
VVEGGNRIDEAIDVSRVDKWQRRMTDQHKQLLTERFARLAEFYGYAVDDPAVLAPLGENGSPVIAGERIDARIEQFPDLDLRTRPEVPLAERFYHPGRMQLHEVPETPPPKPPPPPEPPLPVRVWHLVPRRARQRVAPLVRRLRR